MIQNDLAGIRSRLRGLVIDVGKFDIEPRCQALVLTKLEEALMWATKGIVLAESIRNDLIAEERGG